MYEGGESAPKPKPKQPQAVRVETPPNPSRRRFLTKLVKAVAVLGITSGVVADEWGKKNKEKLPPLQAENSFPPPEPIEPSENKEEIRKNKLNQILSLKLDDPNRKNLEKDYAEWATNLSDIDLGVLCVVNPNSRIQLLDKRYELRKPENATHRPLTPAQLEWAHNEAIHPETLAIALEAREIALRILPQVIKDKGIANFRGDIVEKIKRGGVVSGTLNNLQNNPELMLISAGGMAGLIVTETGSQKLESGGVVEKFIGKLSGRLRYGFANIGRKPAVEMTVDTDAFSKKINDEAISLLARILSQSTGLQFYAENIPGSEPGGNSTTGGAIGIQIMPERAKNMYENLKKFFAADDPLPHPLDLTGATVMAYIFLAQGSFGKAGFQPGYFSPPLEDRGVDISNSFNKQAVKTWNPDDDQAGKIINTDLSFLQKFPKSQITHP